MNRKLALFGFVLVSGISLSQGAYARGHGGPREPRQPREWKPEIVKWVGEIKDDSATHTTEHKHELRFVKKDDSSEFNIVDSPELVKLHHETDKNYLVEIVAEKTPRFLFWGGNLIVKQFKVEAELGSAVPVGEPVQYSKREINR